MTQATQSAQISQKKDECNIYAVKRTDNVPRYYQSPNGLMVTHALGHVMYVELMK